MNLAGLNSGKVRNVGDQFAHPSGVLMQLLDEPFAILRVVKPAGLQRVSISQYCGQRRAQLVREVRKEYYADSLQWFQLRDVEENSYRQVAAKRCDVQLKTVMSTVRHLNAQLYGSL